MVWNEMKNFVKRKFCKTPEEVANAIEEFRLSLTPEKCQNYINRIHNVIKLFLKALSSSNYYYNILKVIEIVIVRNGGWSDC